MDPGVSSLVALCAADASHGVWLQCWLALPGVSTICAPLLLLVCQVTIIEQGYLMECSQGKG